MLGDITHTTMSNLTYPHTTISSDLGRLAVALEGNPELAAVVAGLRQQYNAKRTYWTSRIAELEADAAPKPQATTEDVRSLPGYPHTQIEETISQLRKSLKNSSSPARQVRLDLLDRIASDYVTKRKFLFSTITSLLNK